jgi:hypothetical protein
MTIIGAIAADEIEKRREPIVRAMAGYIARPDHGAAGEQHIRVASALLDATLEALRDDASPSARLPVPIDRNAAARFGDGLVPILKDVIGHGLPPSAFSHASDAYWRMVRGVGIPAG